MALRLATVDVAPEITQSILETLSRCLRTRVARLGLLAVPGDQKRLQRFRLHLLQVEIVNIHIIVKYH